MNAMPTELVSFEIKWSIIALLPRGKGIKSALKDSSRYHQYQSSRCIQLNVTINNVLTILNKTGDSKWKPDWIPSEKCLFSGSFSKGVSTKSKYCRSVHAISLTDGHSWPLSCTPRFWKRSHIKFSCRCSTQMFLVWTKVRLQRCSQTE